MRTLSGIVTFFAVLFVLGGAGIARADSIGSPGRIVGVLHNDNDSDEAGAYTGQLFVDIGGGTIEEYYWGGVLCSGRDLAIDQQRMLLDAMYSKKGLVLPYYKVGQAAVHCLVSFSFAASAKVVPLVGK